MCLVQGGNSFCLLADTVVTYICGAVDISDIIVPVDDVLDVETKTLIDQVIAKLYNYSDGCIKGF